MNRIIVFSIIVALFLGVVGCEQKKLEQIKEHYNLTNLTIEPAVKKFNVTIEGEIPKSRVNHICIGISLDYEKLRRSGTSYDHNLKAYDFTINDSLNRYFKVADLNVSYAYFEFTSENFNSIKNALIPNLYNGDMDSLEVKNFIEQLDSFDPDQFVFMDYKVLENYCKIIIEMKEMGSSFDIGYNINDSTFTSFYIHNQ